MVTSVHHARHRCSPDLVSSDWPAVDPAPTATPCWTAEADPAALDAFGHDMALGNAGGMYFFICRSCPDTPYPHRYGC
ncbi:hypothetical protein [Streptomyces sp. uw30]|uniref:hypothetical protein n=1 Tax=Streptomyces sp. uw30 TaxID=1828179 RepID=UPI0011CD44B0|nr:hypothetical protein [Streptomyces sp. uw30]